MAVKLHLDPKTNSPSMQVLHELFADFMALDVRRRVIELHAYIRVCQLDSKLLAVLRFVDSLHKRSDMMTHRPGEMTIIETIQPGSKILSELAIDSLYKTVRTCQSGNADAVLSEISSYYYTMVRKSNFYIIIIMSPWSTLLITHFHVMCINTPDISACYEEDACCGFQGKDSKATCPSYHLPDVLLWNEKCTHCCHQIIPLIR